MQARAAQEPITATGRLIVDGACQMIESAKQLASNPKDPLIYQQYSSHSHGVSEAIKQIVSAIRYCCMSISTMSLRPVFLQSHFFMVIYKKMSHY